VCVSVLCVGVLCVGVCDLFCVCGCVGVGVGDIGYVRACVSVVSDFLHLLLVIIFKIENILY